MVKFLNTFGPVALKAFPIDHPEIFFTYSILLWWDGANGGVCQFLIKLFLCPGSPSVPLTWYEWQLTMSYRGSTIVPPPCLFIQSNSIPSSSRPMLLLLLVLLLTVSSFARLLFFESIFLMLFVIFSVYLDRYQSLYLYHLVLLTSSIVLSFILYPTRIYATN